ncbi:MAG: PqqD family protein [Candidatus Aminicenantes bacterium]|nr:MAG: PqqD family protein [Candidatus Aminicenantes bacterium]
MKKHNAKPSEVNLLELIPEQNILSEKTEDGFYVLLKPKYRHPWMVKHILPRLKSPHYKIKLDDIGSFIWDHCDGRKTAKEISGKLKEKFGDKVEPLYERLGSFFQNLEKNKFITFKNL